MTKETSSATAVHSLPPMAADNDTIDIREAKPTDHNAIASLLHQLGYEVQPALIAKKLDALLPRGTDDVLVALKGGGIVGVISLHALPLFHEEGYLGRITSLIVDERQRGNGIGTALMSAAETWFAAVGCERFEVTSGDRRHDAHDFYEQRGFAREGQRFVKHLG